VIIRWVRVFLEDISMIGFLVSAIFAFSTPSELRVSEPPLSCQVVEIKIFLNKKVVDNERLEKICDSRDFSEKAKEFLTLVTFSEKNGRFYSTSVIFQGSTILKETESEISSTAVARLTQNGKHKLSDVLVMYSFTEADQPGDETLPTKKIDEILK
jgi:hypothetical protein